MDVGGVRLEDNFLVTETGYEILSDVPRTVEEVESCIRGENWKKRKWQILNNNETSSDRHFREEDV